MSVLFPDVPIAPGVPAVFRQVSSFAAAQAAQNNPTILTADDVDADDATPQWGFFDDALNPVLTGNSTVRVSYVHEYKTSDYPTEEGGFQSYNKVQLPYEVRATFIFSGEQSDVTDSLIDAETTLASLALYTFGTPEASYPMLSLVHMDYDRSAERGAQMIPVEIWSREVRPAPSPSFTKTAAPQGSDVQPGGQVQPQPPTPLDSQAISDAQKSADYIKSGGG